MDMEMFEQNMCAFKALNEEFGEERIFMPPLEDLSEVQDGIRSQCTLKGKFAADTPALKDEVRQLVAQHGSVILLLNTADLSFEVFVPPGKHLIEELGALAQELGEGRIYVLDDNAPKEALELLKHLTYVGSFPLSSSEIVTKIKSLAARHSSVIALLDPPNIEVFVTPNG